MPSIWNGAWHAITTCMDFEEWSDNFNLTMLEIDDWRKNTSVQDLKTGQVRVMKAYVAKERSLANQIQLFGTFQQDHPNHEHG